MSQDERRMRVLHIPAWYPHRENPHEAIWLKRHIEALDAHCENEVFRIEVQSNKGRWKWHTERSDARTRQWRLETPLGIWRIIEVLQFLLLLGVCVFKLRIRRYDLVNIHIAYPTLTYAHWLRGLFGKKLVITEHWSAYHLNFGVTDKRKLARIQHIFHQNIPVIAVSEALIKDIQDFAECSNFPTYCVPNIVDAEQFSHTSSPRTSIFMVSNWQRPKQPELLIRVFGMVAERFPALELRVGGYGHLWSDMQALVDELGLASRVQFLGKLSPEEVAHEMQHARVFMHASGYETFSVVCAEAISCGTPVLASRVGGITEFIDESNGYLVDTLEASAWVAGLSSILETRYAHEAISDTALGRFSKEAVGRMYYDSLVEIRQRLGSN